MKKCIRCKQWKPDSEFYLHEKSKDGLYYYCKDCVKELNAQRLRKASGYANWDPFRLVDDERFGLNLKAMTVFINRGWVSMNNQKWGIDDEEKYAC